MATFILTSRQKPDTVATRPAVQQSQPAINKNIKDPIQVQPVEEVAVEKTSSPAENNNEDVPVITMKKKVQKETAKKPINARVQPAPAEEEIMVVNTLQRSNDAPVLMPEKVEDPVRKSLTKEPVTSEPLYTYNSTNAPVNAVPAVADETEKSRSSLKGLLRKAARNVERRTNINVTNENDELLIGSVAISLK
jgi:hypothetical protein